MTMSCHQLRNCHCFICKPLCLKTFANLPTNLDKSLKFVSAHPPRMGTTFGSDLSQGCEDNFVLKFLITEA